LSQELFWKTLEQQISTAIGQSFTVRQRYSIGGGCINQTWRISDAHQEYFIKVNAATGLAMFAAEAAGLAELAASHNVRVPEPVCWGSVAGQAYLVLEYLPLRGSNTAQAMETLGRQLALLHRQPQPYFGWQRDNTIGSTPQPNGHAEDWIAFWRERRLEFQLRLATRNGHGGALQQQGEALLARFAGLFKDYSPIPSLLHGDLWGGNAGCTVADEPVIFDPAVYYGDRETDLAMTELFGGFPERFYAAYREAWPLDTGYPQRRTLYNLYHILNHLNLFGGGYRSQAERMIGQLLAELR